MPSPEASQNSGAYNSYRVEFWLQKAVTDSIVSPSDLLTLRAAVLSKERDIRFLPSPFPAERYQKSARCLLCCGNTFSTRISSITPPSRAQRLLFIMCEVAPSAHKRTSLLALPPNTGRSCTRHHFDAGARRCDGGAGPRPGRRQRSPNHCSAAQSWVDALRARRVDGSSAGSDCPVSFVSPSGLMCDSQSAKLQL